MNTEGNTMRYTSAEANKLLKALELRRNTIKKKEEKAASFQAAANENIEELRPEYDFAKVQAELASLNAKIREVKHAINVFNVSHTLPGYDGLTIDQALVYLPQLSEETRKLSDMASTLPRERIESFRSMIVDYSIANYDIGEAEKAYEDVSERLTSLQLALDKANNSDTMEIDVVL